MKFLTNSNFISYINGHFLSAGGTLGDAVRHALEPEPADFFGIPVNPSFFSALLVSAALIVFAVILRIFVIPRFKQVPSRFQALLEDFVGYFDKSSESAVHRHSGFIGPYVFTAAVFIGLSTLVEMVGIRPAFADINTCFAFGLTTFIIINISGIRQHGARKRLFRPLKNPINIITDISIPLSLSLRLFGSIMSGFIIMELLYSTLATSLVIPAALSVVTTLFHAFIQAYLFATLTNIFVGEAVELHS